jgi:hypothetical protein
MAKTEIITDDIDGSPNAAPVTFALEGTTYTIDLAEKSLDKLRRALAPFIENAQTSQRAALATIKARNGRADRGYDLVALREWAGGNKIALPQRGRIPGAVIAQYRAAGGR